MRLGHSKKSGRYYIGNSEEMLSYRPLRNLKGKIQLILTSPPFPLNEKKSYGNMTGDQYLEWFASLAPKFAEMLTEDGSIAVADWSRYIKVTGDQGIIHECDGYSLGGKS